MSFDQILEIIRSQNEFIIYGILMVSTFVENIFPPYPGDTVILAGAFIAGEGNVGYFGVLISIVTGGVAGGMFLYYIGRFKGRSYFMRRDSKYFGKSSLVRVERLFDKYGNVVLIFSRFFAGVRSAISIAAGLGNVRPARMLILTLLGNFLWCGLLVGLMIYSKFNWRMILNLVKDYHMVLFTAAFIIVVLWAARRLWIRRK
jgi:membrane protein DedA with SNARE-associated domain